MYNIMTEVDTGRVFAVDKDGQPQPIELLAEALRAAARGDPGATVFVRRLDLSVDDAGRPRDPALIDADLRRSLTDCPLCAAASARGAIPIHTSDTVVTSPAGVITYLSRSERRAQVRAAQKATRRAARTLERAARRPRGADPPYN